MGSIQDRTVYESSNFIYTLISSTNTNAPRCLRAKMDGAVMLEGDRSLDESEKMRLGHQHNESRV